MADLAAAPGAVRPVAGGGSVATDRWLLRGALLCLIGWLALTIALPLGTLFRKALEDAEGHFAGFANFAAYFEEPALVHSLLNTLTIAGISTVITLLLSFGFAYAVTRTAIPGRAI